MIKGFVGQPRMPVISRQPGSRAMAQATVLRRIKVTGIHTRGRGAVVTGRAGAQDLGVINGNNRRPDIRAVAIFADVGGLRVQWTLAGRVCSVMAADAVVDNVRVVKIRGQPRDSSMAVVAIIAAGDMRWMLANGYHTIMTRAASPNNLSVVDSKGRNPGVRCMAIFAYNAGKNMVGILTRCVCAVVATRAISCDVDVVKVRG